MPETSPINSAAVPFDPEAVIDALGPALGLTIAPDHRPGVVGFLKVAAQMAEVVARVPLSDTAFEMAAVFRPGETA